MSPAFAGLKACATSVSLLGHLIRSDRAASIVVLRQIDDHAPAREIEQAARQPARFERRQRRPIDRHTIGQILAAGAVLLFVVLGRKAKAVLHGIGVAVDDI